MPRVTFRNKLDGASGDEVADYYVATTGNDANAGTIGAPWLTVAKALATMVAGETTFVRAGTYSESNLVFSNSGTAGNPITIAGYPGETAIIDAGFTTYTGANTPVFNIATGARSYLTIKRLTIRRGRTFNIWIGDANGPYNQIIVEDNIIEDVVTGDNGAHVRISYSEGHIVVRRNYIHGRQVQGPFTSDGHGIFSFFADTDGWTLEHNEIYDVADGIWWKSGSDRTGSPTRYVGYNKIYDLAGNGIRWDTSHTTFEHNLIYNANSGFYLFEESGACASLTTTHNTFTHNTVVDTTYGFFITRTDTCVATTDNTLTDNLVSHTTDSDFTGLTIWPYFAGPHDSNTTLNSNLIYRSGTASPIRVLAAYYTGATLPGSVPNDGENIVTAPTFVNYAGDDFTLATGSNGENAATDGADMGANIALVGVP